MTTTTIDLAALAADLEALGWKRDRETPSLPGDSYAYRHRGIWVHGPSIRCMEFDDDDGGIDITDPIWQAALPILLRHVAGEGEG